MSRIEIIKPDPSIDALLRSVKSAGSGYTPFFTANEELYLELEDEFQVPNFQIHHDVREEAPSPRYREDLRGLMQQLGERLPRIFQGLRYFFDPAEILRPSFFRLFRAEDCLYLYLLHIDLVPRPGIHRQMSRGSNEETPAYSSSKLFIEADMIPIEEIEGDDENPEVCRVRRSVSDTWIGETGRGYYVQGIWLDRELTKFFTKLFLPEGARTYPYYPLSCKYQAVCHSLYSLEPKRLEQACEIAHQARLFIDPHLEAIQNALRADEFSTELPIFRKLRAELPEELAHYWERLRLVPFLNDRDMKEFRIED
ncbi:MAG: hypothetical protein LC641_11970 [Spirochaeta sp.]|nr:hypothetical protein [Spirochaeta sp.]